MANYTLTYSHSSEGWPSFYSFYPEFMIGMNSYFYSFSGGNLWRHNTNNNRNTYYGSFTPASITSVISPRPVVDIKLFKTLTYESNQAWACTALSTDITDGNPGSMLATYFEQKEGEWFSFIRTNAGTIDWRQRSANGIGDNSGVAGPAAATVISFASSPGNIISIGDTVYFDSTNPTLGGVVTAIDNTAPDYSITIDTTAGGTAPAGGDFIMYIKNSVAESHGARGYYLEFTLTNSDVTPVELFSVGSSVMKSYP